MKFVSERGNSIVSAPIIVAIIFFIFMIFAVTFISILEPFIVYEKLSATSLKYIFIMEEYGYLTGNEREKLKYDLQQKGLDTNKITIRATSELKEYGTPISLILSYDCDIKTPNLLPAVLYSSKADSLGCDEAILLRNNIVTECAHSNIFILKDETLYTHPQSELILPGITRSLLISEAKKINIPVIETPFNLEYLFSADEIIITSTTKLIKNTLSIDNISVGGNGTSIFSELEEKIRKKFQNNN